MHALMLLASEGLKERTLWDPTILGILVVLSAVTLFCGSVYLLLATNLGARLGFLVAAACLTGFLVILSGMWVITATPLNSPHGRQAGWKTIEVVSTPADSSIAAVRAIAGSGEPVAADQLAQLKPELDKALVTPAAEGAGAAPEAGPLAQYGAGSDYLIDGEGLQSYVAGGGTKNLFWHNPRYAAVAFCPAEKVEVPFGEVPPAPVCDPAEPVRVAVLERDLGSLRQPPWVYLFVSATLFGLSLLGLHWREKDERARARATRPSSPTAA